MNHIKSSLLAETDLDTPPVLSPQSSVFCSATVNSMINQTRQHIKNCLDMASQNFNYKTNHEDAYMDFEKTKREIEANQDNTLNLCTEKVLLACQANTYKSRTSLHMAFFSLILQDVFKLNCQNKTYQGWKFRHIYITDISGVTRSLSEICLDLDNVETFSRIKKKPPQLAVTCRRKPLATPPMYSGVHMMLASLLMAGLLKYSKSSSETLQILGKA